MTTTAPFDASDVLALRDYIAALSPVRADVVAETKRKLADDHGALRLCEDHAGDWSFEHRAINEDAWGPYQERLRDHGRDYARDGLAPECALRYASCFRDLTLAALPAPSITRGCLLANDLWLRAISGAYAELFRSLDRELHGVFRDNPVPMWMYNPVTFEFVSVNKAALAVYGYSHRELSAMKVTDIEAEQGGVVMARTLAPYERVRRHRRKDGTVITVELTSTELRSSDSPLRLIAATDVSEREQTRAALERSEQMLRQSQKMDALGRLASGIAHDFNNIVTIVQSYATLLEDSLDGDDQRREDAVEIRRAAERATKLTRQLLTLGRKSDASPRSLSLDDLVAGFAPSLRRLLGATVALDVRPTNAPNVIVDPSQLEQVIMNLAVNARDAMAGVGRVTIETSVEALDGDVAALHHVAPGTYVVLAVTDTGPGIPKDLQARIFDPFFTTKEAGKGTGLGLSIVHGIVTQARGGIELYSEVGHGTTFRIRIPVAGTNAVELERSAPIARSYDLRPVTVLIIDSDDALRAAARRVLETGGCTVVEASRATDAKDVCVSFDGTIDVALLDVALSDERGELLVRALHELRPQLKIILMCGFPMSSLASSGDMPEELLAKPFTPTQLRAAIAAATSHDAEHARPAQPNLQPRILVADDDPLLRKMVSRLLRRSSFETVEVESGQAALEELATRRYDVILSDIHMPGGDGIELLRSVRRIDLDIPVILMSGKPDIQTAATALEYGAFRYLTKPLGTETLEKLVRHAVRAHALARIRREAVAVSGASSIGASDRAGLEVRLDHALDRMWAAFQPIVQARDGVLFGVEALVRSDEPSMPHPGALLDAATQLGRLSALGRRMRAEVGQQLASRIDIPAVFVNIHPRDLHDVDLVDELAPLTRIAPRVVLELTERESLTTTPELVERIRRIRELGFRIAIDDIGAGYSGLTTFIDLMPDIVKIDMSLVRSIASSRVKQRTVQALCALCHEMGVLVVGEGVETADERACLCELGCDLLQGYLIARPARELPPNS